MAFTESMAARIDAYVEDVVRPIAASMARGSGPRPHDVVSAAGEAGVAGLLTPTEYGGAGGTHIAFASLIEAVARLDASTAVIVDVHVSVGTEPIILFGNEEQKSKYLPLLARGEWAAGFALTEPAGGSDAAALQTVAERTSDGYVLRGAKTFITNVGDADLYVVMARTGEGARGISAFLVEGAWSGVKPGRPFEKQGLHGSWTGELVLDDVHVPDANRLGEEGEGFHVAMTALDSGRVGISAQAVGIAQGCIDAVLESLKSECGTPGEVDEVSIADMEAWTVAARRLTLHAAAMVDEGQPVTRDASIAKLYATDAAVAVATRAVDMCAPHSAREDHPAAVRLRDAKGLQIYEGTNQIQRVVIARQLLRDEWRRR